MNENKKKILLKILNVKSKQFKQNVFHDFLEDQNIKAKQDHFILINAMK